MILATAIAESASFCGLTWPTTPVAMAESACTSGRAEYCSGRADRLIGSRQHQTELHSDRKQIGWLSCREGGRLRQGQQARELAVSSPSQIREWERNDDNVTSYRFAQVCSSSGLSQSFARLASDSSASAPASRVRVLERRYRASCICSSRGRALAPS